ncbi:MAG: glycosyl hydrolase family 43 [Thermodesulfobacteriota bacterium]
MRRTDFAMLPFAEHPANPIIRAPFPSPIIADPTFLPPDEGPDGRWHLFAHSLFGIHHFTSDDGISWRRRELLWRNALRAFVLRSGAGEYLLFHERCRLMLPILPGVAWSSRIEVRRSTDLRRWSEPATVLEPGLSWHEEPGRGRAVGNPCVVPLTDGFRLYYSAGLVFLPDCGFCEPRSIGHAEAERATGPFRPAPQPLLRPSADDPLANAGAGAIKVLRVADGFVGFQNGIAWDAARRRSSSAIRLLESEDGLAWRAPRREPLLAPSPGWKGSHVYALDVRLVAGRPWLYFNARSRAHWLRGREAIGLVRADVWLAS